MSLKEDNRHEFKLISPASKDPLIFMVTPENQIRVGSEIVEVIKIACTIFTELSAVLDRSQPLQTVDVSNFDELQKLIATFNKASKTIAKLWKGATKPMPGINEGGVFERIWYRVYSRAVKNPQALNTFSSETYGETSFHRMQTILEQLQPTKNDVLVDLGSGIGQLVIHAAAVTPMKRCVGIEIADLPNEYAKKVQEEFRLLMSWLGQKANAFDLEQGDFLDKKFRQLIVEEATILIINNVAFRPELDDRIQRELLMDLEDGIRIVTTKAYGKVGRSSIISERSMKNIASILDVEQLDSCEDSASWTSKPVPYYLHTVNSSRIEQFYEKLKSSKSPNASCSSRPWSSPSKESTLTKNSDPSDEAWMPPTPSKTRRKAKKKAKKQKCTSSSSSRELPTIETKFKFYRPLSPVKEATPVPQEPSETVRAAAGTQEPSEPQQPPLQEPSKPQQPPISGALVHQLLNQIADEKMRRRRLLAYNDEMKAEINMLAMNNERLKAIQK
ncbi:hypothetical protein L596_000220 [Steinernema carpocapsae]|uniref:Histone-lysine N-methyltransferase, H3 lysine-79 specific n=1 Tax=Steinernema carpocapsae TaxID=34508 RepID=A0A4U8UIA9_STECR|nr:hypothetical protein L596_000220 [Steinernema carpocapsae]